MRLTRAAKSFAERSIGANENHFNQTGEPNMKKSLQHIAARSFAIAIAALFLLVMVTASAVGQQETGQITGRVVDPQDRVVPGATVTVKSVGTGAERTATADDQGIYLVTN